MNIFHLHLSIFQNEWVWASTATKISCPLLAEMTGVEEICGDFPRNPASDHAMSCLATAAAGGWAVAAQCGEARRYWCELSTGAEYELDHTQLVFDSEGEVGYVEIKPKFLDHDGVHSIQVGRLNTCKDPRILQGTL